MIVGTSRFHRRHYGEDLFVTIAHKFGGMPLAAIEVGAAVTSAIAVEQLLQEHAPHLMHGRANGHLAGFQIQVSQPLAILQHLPHEPVRSEEHTSELQSLTNLVCRLLLETKNPN